MKKSFTAAAMLLALYASSSFAAGTSNTGKITFNGSVVEASCGIAPDSVDQTIEMGETPRSKLVNGGKSTPVPFTISLQDCDGTANAAEFRFAGNNWAEDPRLQALTGVPNVGLALLSDNNGDIIDIQQPLSRNIAGITGGIDLPFSAQLIGTTGAGTIVPNQYQVVTTFQITYL
jgi:type 1 fimbria pilin